MSLQRQVTFWAAIAVIFAVLLYLLSDVVMPFVAGMALAYFLDPVADRLERAGFGRLAATVTILFAFLLLFTAVLLLLVPVLGQQLAAFIERLPDYVTRLQGLLTQLAEGRLGRLVDENLEQLKEQLGGIVSQSAQWLATLLSSLWSGGQAVAGVLSLFIITPIVAFYLLYDWDRMVAKLDTWLPRDHAPTIRKLAREIDTTLSAFVRGQGSSCLVLGTYYAIALSLTGLNFGLLIGLATGLISFIPFIGATVGLVAAGSVALVQFWPDWVMISVVVAIFLSGQVLEGYVLQPYLVGTNVGLHPVVLMFALLAFGALFGFVGMLVAVPAAAALRVLLIHALQHYLTSPIYRGVGVTLPDDEPPESRE